jgi:hypothetical protein
MPYIANPLEGIPLVNTFITDQDALGTTPATDDKLIIYDESATALKRLTIAELQASVLVSPAFTGTPTAPTQSAGNDTTRLATTAFVTAATTALNTVTEMTDVTITSIASDEVLKWNGSAWINNTLAEANILPVAGPTFTGVLTVGSAVISEADLEQIDDLTAGTAVANKALVVDGSKNIATIGTIGSGNITSSGTIEGTTITATTAFVPDASDGAALGTAALEFSDLFLADAAVISLGDDDDVTLTHVVDTGILLSSTDRFQFGDAGTFIHQSADGVLTITSDTTVDINGAVVFDGALSGITTVASGAITSSGIIKTDDATEATSTTDGSLQTDGGLSVVKDAVFGDDVKLLSDAAVLSFGANSEVTLTHVHDDGLLLNTDMQLQFRDSAINIRSDADGDLDINADDELELNSTLIDINGAVDISGTLTMSGGTLDMSGEDVDNIRSATFIAEVDNGNSSTADTIDWGAAQKQKSTLTGNCTYTFTAPDGPCNLMFKVIQDGTGSRTVTWPNTVKWPAATAVVLTTTASATDMVAFYYDGTNYYAMATLAFG